MYILYVNALKDSCSILFGSKDKQSSAIQTLHIKYGPLTLFRRGECSKANRKNKMYQGKNDVQLRAWNGLLRNITFP